MPAAVKQWKGYGHQSLKGLVMEFSQVQQLLFLSPSGMGATLTCKSSSATHFYNIHFQGRTWKQQDACAGMSAWSGGEGVWGKGRQLPFIFPNAAVSWRRFKQLPCSAAHLKETPPEPKHPHHLSTLCLHQEGFPELGQISPLKCKFCELLLWPHTGYFCTSIMPCSASSGLLSQSNKHSSWKSKYVTCNAKMHRHRHSSSQFTSMILRINSAHVSVKHNEFSPSIYALHVGKKGFYSCMKLNLCRKSSFLLKLFCSFLSTCHARISKYLK